MTDKEKVAWILFNGPECPVSGSGMPWDGECECCPLASNETGCCISNGAVAALEAKGWFFDRYIGKEKATSAYGGWGKKHRDKKIKKAHIPDECIQIYPPDYKHLMLVRVFVRNFKDGSLDEVDGLFVLSHPKDEGAWFIKANEKITSHGFGYDRRHGWCRPIFQNGQYLSDVIVLAVEEQKPNMAHKKNNYRKLKT